MNKDVVKNSIICLSNMKIEDTTYQIARDIVLQELEDKDKEIKILNNIINELEKELFIKKEFYERDLTIRPKNDSEYNTKYANSCALAQISIIYDKLQELKGSAKE